MIGNIINSIQPQINFICFTFFYSNYKLMPIMIIEVLQNSQMCSKSLIKRKYFQ